MLGSIRSVTGAALTALDYLSTQPGPPLAVRDWMRQGRGVVFLPYQANEIAALCSIIAAWLRLAIFQCMSDGEGDKRIWFVVDELDALGSIGGLKDALARLRKFGGRFGGAAQVLHGNGIRWPSGKCTSTGETDSVASMFRCCAPVLKIW